jgi:hypothetical protein
MCNAGLGVSSRKVKPIVCRPARYRMLGRCSPASPSRFLQKRSVYQAFSNRIHYFWAGAKGRSPDYKKQLMNPPTSTPPTTTTPVSSTEPTRNSLAEPCAEMIRRTENSPAERYAALVDRGDEIMLDLRGTPVAGVAKPRPARQAVQRNRRYRHLRRRTLHPRRS